MEIKIEKRTINVKCKTGKEYKVKIGYFIMEAQNEYGSKLIDKNMSHDNNYTDNLNLFENKLG